MFLHGKYVLHIYTKIHVDCLRSFSSAPKLSITNMRVPCKVIPVCIPRPLECAIGIVGTSGGGCQALLNSHLSSFSTTTEACWRASYMYASAEKTTGEKTSRANRLPQKVNTRPSFEEGVYNRRSALISHINKRIKWSMLHALCRRGCRPTCMRR